MNDEYYHSAMRYTRASGIIKIFFQIFLALLSANTASAQGTYIWRGVTDDWNTSNWLPTGIPGKGDNAVIAGGTVNLHPSTMLSNVYFNGGILLSGTGTLTVTTDRAGYTLYQEYKGYDYIDRYYRDGGTPFAIGTGLGQQGGITQTGGTLNLHVGRFYIGGSPLAANDMTTAGQYKMTGGTLNAPSEYLSSSWDSADGVDGTRYNNYYDYNDNHILVGNYGAVGLMDIGSTATANINMLSVGTYGGFGQLTVQGAANVDARTLVFGGELSIDDPLLKSSPRTGGTGRGHLISGTITTDALFMGGGGVGFFDMEGGELNAGYTLLGQGGGSAFFNQYGGDHNAMIMGVGVNLTHLYDIVDNGTMPKIPDYKDPNSPVSVYNQYGGTVTAMLAGAGVLANGAWIIGAPIPADPYADFNLPAGIENVVDFPNPADYTNIDAPKVKAFAMLGGAQGVGQITLLKGEVDTAITGLGLLGGGAELNVLGGVYGKRVDGVTAFEAVMDMLNTGDFTNVDVGSVITVMGVAAGQGTLNVAGGGEFNSLITGLGILDGKGVANIGPGGTLNSTIGLIGVLGEGTLNVAGGTAKFEEFRLTIPGLVYDDVSGTSSDADIIVDGIVAAGVGGLGVDTLKLLPPLVQLLFGNGGNEALNNLHIDITASPSPGTINLSAGALSTDYMLLGGLGAEGTLNQTGGTFTANKDVYLAGTVGLPPIGELADSLLGSLVPAKDENGYYIVEYWDNVAYQYLPIPRDPATGAFLDGSGNVIQKNQYGEYYDPAYGYFTEPAFPEITYPADLGPTKAQWNVAGGSAEVGGDLKMGVYFTIDSEKMPDFNDPNTTEFRAMDIVTTQDPTTLAEGNSTAGMSAKLNIIDGSLRVHGDISVYSDADAEINVFGGKGELQTGSLNAKGYVDDNGNGNKVNLNFHIGDDGVSTIHVDGVADTSGENTVGMWGGFVTTTQTEYDVVTAGTLTGDFIFTDNTPFHLQTSYIDNGDSTTVRLSWGGGIADVDAWDLTGIHVFGEDAAQVVMRLSSETIRDENLVVSFNGLTEELAPLLAAYLSEGLAGSDMQFQLYTANSLVLSGDYFLDSPYTYFAWDLEGFNTMYGNLGANISLHSIMVPEPASWTIMLLGISVVLYLRRRKN